LHDVRRLDVRKPRGHEPDAPSKPMRSPSDITFVRSRMFYARAALTGRGAVDTGLHHIREFGGIRHAFARHTCL